MTLHNFISNTRIEAYRLKKISITLWLIYLSPFSYLMLKISKLLSFWIGLFIAISYIPLTVAGDGDPECDPGQTYSWGLASCIDCEPGRYNPTGVGACLPCEIGTFQSEPGSRSCNLCEPGTFTDFTQSTSCSPCPAGWESGPWASECFKTTWRSSSIAEGKFLTEWNEADTNDTEAPLSSYDLSENEKTLVQSFVEKLHILIQLSSSPDSMYDKTLLLIQAYLAEFHDQGDAKKVARAEELLALLKSLFGK